VVHDLIITTPLRPAWLFPYVGNSIEFRIHKHSDTVPMPGYVYDTVRIANTAYADAASTSVSMVTATTSLIAYREGTITTTGSSSFSFPQYCTCIILYHRRNRFHPADQIKCPRMQTPWYEEGIRLREVPCSKSFVSNFRLPCLSCEDCFQRRYCF
jgi:hypothetical protein